MTRRVAPPRTPPRCKLQCAVLFQDFPGQVLLHVANLVELRIFEQVAATCRKAGAVELLAQRLHLARALDVLWRRRADLLPTPTGAHTSPSRRCPKQRLSHHRRSHLHFLQHTKCVRIRLGLKGSISSCQHSDRSSRARCHHGGRGALLGRWLDNLALCLIALMPMSNRTTAAPGWVSHAPCPSAARKWGPNCVHHFLSRRRNLRQHRSQLLHAAPLPHASSRCCGSPRSSSRSPRS